jgi:hypothetical protein
MQGRGQIGHKWFNYYNSALDTPVFIILQTAVGKGKQHPPGFPERSSGSRGLNPSRILTGGAQAIAGEREGVTIHRDLPKEEPCFSANPVIVGNKSLY